MVSLCIQLFHSSVTVVWPGYSRLEVNTQHDVSNLSPLIPLSCQHGDPSLTPPALWVAVFSPAPRTATLQQGGCSLNWPATLTACNVKYSRCDAANQTNTSDQVSRRLARKLTAQKLAIAQQLTDESAVLVKQGSKKSVKWRCAGSGSVTHLSLSERSL